MPLYPDDPFKQFEKLRDSLDRFFSELPLNLNWMEEPFNDIVLQETANEIIATCHIPNLEKKADVTIKVEGDLLSISGHLKQENKVDGEGTYQRAYYSQSFLRTVPLPSPVYGKNAKIDYKNGVLEVRMPKVILG
ncbi:MAG: Hsp20/alpha crystallin family protein [Lysinibacillus sp.]